jgi:hypothetical protein
MLKKRTLNSDGRNESSFGDCGNRASTNAENGISSSIASLSI